MKKGLLSTISTMAGLAVGGTAAGAAVYKMKEKEVEMQNERANKNAAVIRALANWITLMQDGKSVVSFLRKYQYETVAIYGMHYIGERLYRELVESGIEVKYAIDQIRNNTPVNVPLKRLGDPMEEVDAVIVTPIFYYDSIEEELMEIFDCPIISFDEILEEVSSGECEGFEGFAVENTTVENEAE